MSQRTFVPDRGDLVWITLNPSVGHEQSGRRPAVVISPKSYNHKTGLCIICPATRQAKGYAFEVNVSDANEVPSIVLSDHLRSVDWRERKVEIVRRINDHALSEIKASYHVIHLEYA